MARVARVLVADKNINTVNVISERLRARGFTSLLETSGAEALSRIRAERPDVVILGTGLDDMSPSEVAARIPEDPERPHVPTLIVDGTGDPAHLTEALANRIDGYILAPFTDEELFANIYAALRLEIMQGELRNRQITMQHYGIENYGEELLTETDAMPRALVVAANDIGHLKQAIGDAADVEESAGYLGVGNLLADGRHEAAIIGCTQATAEEALRCVGEVRRVPTLYHLPLLLVAPKNAFEDPREPYRAGASGMIDSATSHAQLRGRLAIMVKQERLRRRILKACRHGGGPQTNDTLTGVFSESFMHKHLELLVQEAFRWEKNLSVTVIYMPEIHRVRVEHGDRAADALFRQLADMVSRLVRGEDLCARLGETGFCVVLPESSLEGTGAIMHRLSGVVRSSEFVLPGVPRAITVQPRLASAEYKPSDTPAALLGRALVAAAVDAAA